MTELDELDRTLLERIQVDFPLTPRPFATLGEALGLQEAEMLARVRDLKEAGLIRQIGAIFDTRRLGYQSTLAAFHVPEDAMEAVAAQISAHPGVSHNYARPHHYNLWFTLAVPPGQDVADEVIRLAGQTGVDDWLNLPASRIFKIRTHFRLDRGGDAPAEVPANPGAQSRAFEEDDIPYVRVLQNDLPLVPRPFAHGAGRLDVREDTLLARAREMISAGIMRRFAAVLRHRQAGYGANGMACWAVPLERIEEVGLLAARFSQVSHCYQRPAHPPRWPYTLFTMIHGRTKNAVAAVVAEIARETGIEEYQVLYSTREFKKERVRYFQTRGVVHGVG
jgi:DNA-binding Lrp family transcriptional regulator